MYYAFFFALRGHSEKRGDSETKFAISSATGFLNVVGPNGLSNDIR